MLENTDFLETGAFCCSRCTLAFWRHFWVGDFGGKEAIMLKGLQMMKDSRLGDGKWRYFPFYYAVYTLLSLDLEPANAELRYARPAMEQYAKKTRASAYSKRRVTIFENALDKVN